MSLNYGKGKVIKHTEKRKEKKKKRPLTKEEKLDRAKLEDKYMMLFHIIYKVGNKVMLESQLVNLCVKFRLLGRDYDVSTLRKVLKKMEKLQMIELPKWQSNTRCNMIVMEERYIKKSAKYFETLLGYKHGINKEDSNAQYGASICRTQHLLNILHPNTIRKHALYSAEDIFIYLDKYHSLYHQRGRGSVYIENFKHLYGDKLLLSNNEFNDMIELYTGEFNGLLSRNTDVILTDITNENIKSEYHCGVYTKQQEIIVKVNIFDIQDRVNIDSLLESASKTIRCFDYSLNKRLELRKSDKCRNCKDKANCIYTINSSKGQYQKLVGNCTEDIYVFDRIVKYKINIYAYSSGSCVKMKDRAVQDKKYQSGESSGESVLNYYLSKQTRINFNNIEVNFKSLDIDRLYITGKRPDKFIEINQAKKEANTPEVVIKTKEKSELSGLLSDINSLPKEMQERVIIAIRKSLDINLKQLNKNDKYEDSKKEDDI